MTPEEARRIADADRARLRDLEDEVARRANMAPGPVMLALVRALVEMVCARDGAHFATLYKRRFYEGVIRMLDQRGIR